MIYENLYKFLQGTNSVLESTDKQYVFLIKRHNIFCISELNKATIENKIECSNATEESLDFSFNISFERNIIKMSKTDNFLGDTPIYLVKIITDDDIKEIECVLSLIESKITKP